MPAGPTTRLRPFFGYYGGKWRDTPRQYPPPRCSTIVEPFAGSAGYSLRYPENRIVLCELDPVIAGIWKYLIAVKASEILRIPDLGIEGSVDDLKVCQEAKWLVGFWLNRGTTGPRKKPSRWMREGIRPGSFWGERVRQTIAAQVSFIRHWRIRMASYEQCSIDGDATWFVDPPYQRGGEHYRCGSREIDYGALARWCMERRGQVIVCENSEADWLPFRALSDVKTTRSAKRSKEVYWLSDFQSSRAKTKASG